MNGMYCMTKLAVNDADVLGDFSSLPKSLLRSKGIPGPTGPYGLRNGGASTIPSNLKSPALPIKPAGPAIDALPPADARAVRARQNPYQAPVSAPSPINSPLTADRIRNFLQPHLTAPKLAN